MTRLRPQKPSKMRSKVVPRRSFSVFAQPLFLNDSTMNVLVFWGAKRSLDDLESIKKRASFQSVKKTYFFTSRVRLLAILAPKLDAQGWYKGALFRPKTYPNLKIGQAPCQDGPVTQFLSIFYRFRTIYPLILPLLLLIWLLSTTVTTELLSPTGSCAFKYIYIYMYV